MGEASNSGTGKVVLESYLFEGGRYGTYSTLCMRISGGIIIAAATLVVQGQPSSRTWTMAWMA